MFTGNLMGAIPNALPHLSTPRGDRQRSARQAIHDIQLVIDLGPELLIAGHGEPVAGGPTIRRELEKLRDARSLTSTMRPSAAWPRAGTCRR